MSIDLAVLDSCTRLLFSIPLKPVQGERFQPTGFPGLGAATYQTSRGMSLLVESAQSMANRLEGVCWDDVAQQPIPALQGISHVRILRREKERAPAFLSDSLLEAHRLNSPYLLEGKEKPLFHELREALGGLEEGPIDRKRLAEVVLNFDVCSLLHGLFLAKKELAGGRLRIARALTAFIEADDVAVAASGGVKNDHVNPSGVTREGFGNVPFARDEYVARSITLYVNLDLAQLRGYGLGPEATRLLVLLALFKLRVLVGGEVRLRTACDLLPASTGEILADRPAGFALPSRSQIETDLKDAISACSDRMKVRDVEFNDDLKKSKDGEGSSTDSNS